MGYVWLLIIDMLIDLHNQMRMFYLIFRVFFNVVASFLWLTVRAITKILRPIREFTDSFVDDVAPHSDQ